MLRKLFSGISLVLSLLASLGAAKCFGDTVSKPTRLYGLGDLRAITVSLDRRFMATAGQGGAFLWNLQTGDLLFRLEVNWSVTSLAFSPDGETLLGASRGTILSWATASGDLTGSYLGHVGDVYSLHFATDGQTFVSAGNEAARIWSVETGEQIHSMEVPGSSIFAAAIAPNGLILATIDAIPTNCVKIWDIATETLLRSLPKTNWSAHELIFTPDGRLVTSGADRGILLWDAETAQEIRSFQGINAPTIFVHDVWTPDHSTLAVVGNDGRVFLWNLDTAESPQILPGQTSLAAAGIPGVLQTMTAGNDFILRLRELPSGNVVLSFAGHTASTFSAVAFSSNGRYVLGGGTEEATRLWNRQTGEPVRNFMGTGSGTMAGAFSPDGSNVLTTVGLPNPAARLWKTETGELLREFKWTGSWAMCAAFSKSGHRVAAGAQDARIRIYDTTNGVLLRTLTGSGWITAVGFSPNAPLVVGGSSDGTVSVFNYETGQFVRGLFFDAGRLVATLFSPDGQTLLIAWTDGVLHLYDANTFERRHELSFASFLDSATFSPDGQYVLTGEGWPLFTASVRDSETLEPLRTFEGHKWTPSAVAFSHDGASILTAGELVREWSVPDLAARLRVQKLQNHLRLTWSFGQLERAPSLDGPWETVNNATSPLEVELGGLMRFYRVFAGDTK